jgi:hypothetical protein
MPPPPFVAEHRDSTGNHPRKAEQDTDADNCKEGRVS